MINPHRGDIWLIRFDPQEGSEIAKTRPGVVMNLDLVGRLALRIVVPLTDWKEYYTETPWLLYVSPSRVNNLAKECAADCNQIKLLSLTRFIKKIGRMELSKLDSIAARVAYCIGA